MVGRIVDSSNHALLVTCRDGDLESSAIYKPLRGERPLWDYPDGSLVARERAAYLLSHAGGFDVVPPTVLREGPFGPGSLQAWVGDVGGPDSGLVEVFAPHAVPDGWLVVLSAQDQHGEPVVLAHADDARLRSVAVLDAVLNNSDRKGSHLLLEGERLRGIDHGVSLGVEPKLRTVLWGWAGQPLREQDLTKLAGLEQDLADAASALRTSLDALLPGGDVRALAARVGRLRREGIHPRPGRGWPALPWPPL